MSGSLDGSVILWDLASGGGDDDKPGRVWGFSAGLARRGREGHHRAVVSIAVTPLGGRAYATSGDGTVRIWDLNVSTGLPAMEAGRHTVTATVDDNILAGGIDQFDRGGAARPRFESGANGCAGLGITPAGRRVVATDQEIVRGALSVWDIETGEMVRARAGHDGFVSDLAFSAEGDRLAGDNAGQVRFLAE